MLTAAATPGNEITAADPRSFFAREPAVDLATAHVAVLGCGSVGGLAAWCLAGAGVGGLELADRERLEPDNLRRHVAGSAELGQPKAAALVRILHERFPATSVTAREFCFLDRPDAVRELIACSDAVLVAVDAEGPKHLIDAAARTLGRPVVYAGVYGGGWAGEVVLTDPDRATPCYGCAARALGRTGIPLWPMAATTDYALPAAERPETDWARADLSSLLPCAALAARVLVAWLAGRRGHDRPLRELTGDGATAWRLALRQVQGWGGPWELLPVSVPRLPGCPVCGEVPATAERLAELLEEGVR
jgi:molybdopterin-synthase adenylyltransferase